MEAVEIRNECQKAGTWPGSGSGKGGALVRKALVALAVAVAVVGVAGLWHSAPVEATSHSAVRSFSASWVLPGGRLEVTIAVSG